MLPGEMTPVPLEKIPVRLALAPEATVVGFAMKLVMAGWGVDRFTKLPVEQPVSPIKHRLRKNVTGAQAFKRVITTPVTEATNLVNRQCPNDWGDRFTPKRCIIFGSGPVLRSACVPVMFRSFRSVVAPLLFRRLK
jgi:hypothetical protein